MRAPLKQEEIGELIGRKAYNSMHSKLFGVARSSLFPLPWKSLGQLWFLNYSVSSLRDQIRNRPY